MSDETRSDVVGQPGQESRVQADAEKVEKEVYNAAQRARGAQGSDVKRLTDSANVLGGETWENPSGHSGTPRGYVASGVIVLGFIVGGVGLTVGPRVLIWIGVAIIVVAGVLGLATHVWSDYRRGLPAEELEAAVKPTEGPR